MSKLNSGFTNIKDIENWLNNKLEDSWSSEKISSYISSKLLELIKNKFIFLETPIKLRILISFLTLKKKNILEMKNEIQDIIQLSQKDEDEWVRIISLLIQYIIYQEKNKNNYLNINHEVFKKTIEHLLNISKFS